MISSSLQPNNQPAQAFTQNRHPNSQSQPQQSIHLDILPDLCRKCAYMLTESTLFQAIIAEDQVNQLLQTCKSRKLSASDQNACAALYCLLKQDFAQVAGILVDSVMVDAGIAVDRQSNSVARSLIAAGLNSQADTSWLTVAKFFSDCVTGVIEIVKRELDSEAGESGKKQTENSQNPENLKNSAKNAPDKVEEGEDKKGSELLFEWMKFLQKRTVLLDYRKSSKECLVVEVIFSYNQVKYVTFFDEVVKLNSLTYKDLRNKLHSESLGSYMFVSLTTSTQVSLTHDVVFYEQTKLLDLQKTQNSLKVAIMKFVPQLAPEISAEYYFSKLSFDDIRVCIFYLNINHPMIYFKLKMFGFDDVLLTQVITDLKACIQNPEKTKDLENILTACMANFEQDLKAAQNNYQGGFYGFGDIKKPKRKIELFNLPSQVSVLCPLKLTYSYKDILDALMIKQEFSNEIDTVLVEMDKKHYNLCFFIDKLKFNDQSSVNNNLGDDYKKAIIIEKLPGTALMMIEKADDSINND